MPYTTNSDDLPDNVKELPAKQKAAWVKTWNAVYARCQEAKGEDCEGQAFATANSVVKRMKDGQEEMSLPSVELSADALTDGRFFDGLAVGDFTDMLGRGAGFKADELPTYLENTLAAIQSTRSESGEIVGLPIDARGHDKGDGAGWIVGAMLEGERIRFLPRWTEVGRDLITKGIRRFFSATVDMTNKVILGGTLTNWPATRNKAGHVLLRPVELSNPDKEAIKMDENITIDQVKELVNATVAEALQAAQKPPEVELSAEERDAQMAELREQYRTQVRVELEREFQAAQRKTETVELAKALVTGFDGAPRGYRADANELQAHLLKLDPDEAKFWAEFLKKTQSNGFVEFEEIGHGKNPKALAELGEEYARILRDFVKDGGTVAEFFSINREVLGDQAGYNLAAFEKKE